jgi:hypothetical protein
LRNVRFCPTPLAARARAESHTGGGAPQLCACLCLRARAKVWREGVRREGKRCESPVGGLTRTLLGELPLPVLDSVFPNRFLAAHEPASVRG